MKEPIKFIEGLSMTLHPGLNCGDEGPLHVRGTRIPWSGKNGVISEKGELEYDGRIGLHIDCPKSAWITLIPLAMTGWNVLTCESCLGYGIPVPSSITTYGQLRMHASQTTQLLVEHLQSSPLLMMLAIPSQHTAH